MVVELKDWLNSGLLLAKMATSRISELASLIATSTADVESHLASKGLSAPTFDAEVSSHAILDDRIAVSRQVILEATDELHSLMLGPVGILTTPSVCTTLKSNHF